MLCRAAGRAGSPESAVSGAVAAAGNVSRTCTLSSATVPSFAVAYKESCVLPWKLPAKDPRSIRSRSCESRQPTVAGRVPEWTETIVRLEVPLILRRFR